MHWNTHSFASKPHNSFQLWSNSRNVHISKSPFSQPTLAPFQIWGDLRHYQWLEKLSSLHGPVACKSYCKYFWWVPCWQQTGPVCQLEGSPEEVQEITSGCSRDILPYRNFGHILIVSRETDFSSILFLHPAATLMSSALQFRSPSQMSYMYKYP